MESQYLKGFVEEFVEQFEIFVQSARDLYQSRTPINELNKLRGVISQMRMTCMMLNIDNLFDFFKAFEEFLNKVNMKSTDSHIPFELNKALDMGYNKFREIDEALQNGKPTEKINKLYEIETLIDVESFYSYSPN
ncbi:MAG: hypothetical protein ACXAC7_13825 [Candidatus Hodarchaeales archaeon]